MIIGKLIDGCFYCNECSISCSSQPIRVYLENVLPYSQECAYCNTLVVDGWKSVDNSPLNLFDLSCIQVNALDRYEKQILDAIGEGDWEAVSSLKWKAVMLVLKAINRGGIICEKEVVKKLLFLLEK